MRRAPLLHAVALTLALAGGCATGSPEAAKPATVPANERGIVVFVPGITGTTMRDQETGRIVWGDFRSLFLPVDSGYAIAMPLGGAGDRLEPAGPILRIGALPKVRRDVYLPIVAAYEQVGYRRGDDLILYGYDWRRDSIENARLLARRLDAIATASPERAIHLVCQSNATYLCRWAVRYGDVSLDDAEAGARARPRERVASVTMLATANGGGIRILRELNRGRRYVTLIGRRFRPEVFFTCESLYQDLPAGRDDLFVDEEGRPLDIDLFDARNWKTYGWAIFGHDAAKRAAGAPEIFGDESTQLAALQRWLERAKRMQAALLDDTAPWPDGVRLVSIQGQSYPTVSRAVVMRDGGAWKTLFLGDRELEGRPALDGLLSEPGDIHASLRSQQTLAPSELRALGDATHYIKGDHLGIAHQPEAWRILVETARGAN
ncbi:MAG: hypothetical protein WC538_23340 [Thermoanaerobaculia bacterium]|jgi:hypothetical protein